MVEEIYNNGQDVYDANESIVVIFWNSKHDMDAYYQPHNNTLSDLIENAKTSLNKSQKEAVIPYQCKM